MHKPLRTIVSAAVVSMMANSVAHAGGFSLYTEANGSAVGNFGAGVAAEAADASTGWYNPAGLVMIPNQQLIFAGNGVFPIARLTGTSTFTTPGLPDFVENFRNIDAGRDALVPSVHYVKPLGPNAAFGLSIVSPFGLSTLWEYNSPVRYQGTFTEVLTTTVSPEIAGRFNDNFSIGAGVDLQYGRVKLNRMLGVPTLLQASNLPPSLLDTSVYNKAHSYGVGFHAGLLGVSTDKHTRVGLNYQSRIKHTFHGNSYLSGQLATPGNNIFNPFANVNFNSVFSSSSLYSNAIDLPDIVTLSAYRDINDSLAILGSIVYTGWSVFKQIELYNVAAPVINPGTGAITQGLVSSVVPENYSDTWRFALGANYKVTPLFMLRVGGGYDQTPTNDIDRDVRLPDANRWALSVGAHYQMRPWIGVDFGYTHLFAANTPVVNRTDFIGTNSFNVNARGSARADIVGAQLVWNLDYDHSAGMTK